MTVNNYSYKKPCDFRDLIETRYARRIYRKVVKVLIDPSRSHELVGEIIEEACEHYTSCPPVKELQIFLYSLAYNKSMEYKRRQIGSY